MFKLFRLFYLPAHFKIVQTLGAFKLTGGFIWIYFCNQKNQGLPFSSILFFFYIRKAKSNTIWRLQFHRIQRSQNGKCTNTNLSLSVHNRQLYWGFWCGVQTDYFYSYIYDTSFQNIKLRNNLSELNTLSNQSWVMKRCLLWNKKCKWSLLSDKRWLWLVNSVILRAERLAKKAQIGVNQVQFIVKETTQSEIWQHFGYHTNEKMSLR